MHWENKNCMRLASWQYSLYCCSLEPNLLCLPGQKAFELATIPFSLLFFVLQRASFKLATNEMPGLPLKVKGVTF
jgi:hypothetical protein